jgi:hypothetical protein
VSAPTPDPKDLAIASLQGQLADVVRDYRELRRTTKQSEWWANAESRRVRRGRWEFYRDKRDWWVGVFLSERATYIGFLTLIAKRRRGGAS